MRSNPHPISNPLGCRVRSMGICKAELRLHEDYCRQVPATQPKVVAAATAQHGHTHRATICTLRHVLLIRPLCPLKLEDKLVRKVHKLRAQSGVGERVLVVNVVSHGGYLSTGRRATTGAWCHLTVCHGVNKGVKTCVLLEQSVVTLHLGCKEGALARFMVANRAAAYLQNAVPAPADVRGRCGS